MKAWHAVHVAAWLFCVAAHVPHALALEGGSELNKGSPGTSATSPAIAEAVASLGVRLLGAQTDGSPNGVLSPVSIYTTLSLVRDAARGTGAREISELLGSPRRARPNRPASSTFLDPDDTGLARATRLWVDDSLWAALKRRNLRAATGTVADVQSVRFANQDQAADAINAWARTQTHERHDRLVDSTSLGGQTQLLFTDALYFRRAWAQPFDPAQTHASPFALADGQTVDVPMMSGIQRVRMTEVDGWTVYELPFEGKTFALMVAVPESAEPLDAMRGVDILGWHRSTTSIQCQVELPKFSLQANSSGLKSRLERLGVQTVFGSQADFGRLLKRWGRQVRLADIVHGASVDFDEYGGVASAATAAIFVPKTLLGVAPRRCAVDRPFFFAVVSTKTGVPVIAGRVGDPTRH